jgi:hypothetical protein
MANVKELENAITNLSPEDYKELRNWFEEYPAIKETADKNFQLLKENPSHPSLRFKKVSPYWSVHIPLKTDTDLLLLSRQSVRSGVF